MVTAVLSAGSSGRTGQDHGSLSKRLMTSLSAWDGAIGIRYWLVGMPLAPTRLPFRVLVGKSTEKHEGTTGNCRTRKSVGQESFDSVSEDSFSDDAARFAHMAYRPDFSCDAIPATFILAGVPLSEKSLIEGVRRSVGRSRGGSFVRLGIGDDCAVLKVPRG